MTEHDTGVKNMKNKAIFITVISALLAVTFCGCGAEDNNSASSAPESSVIETTKTEESSVVSKQESKQESKKESSVVSKQESKKESEKESSVASKQESKTESSTVSKQESKQESKPESFVAPIQESSEQIVESSIVPESSVAPIPEPSPEPVPEPSPEPVQESSQKPQESSAAPKPKPQPQPTGTPVDASWFNDALFVGDSVTLKLSYYADYGSLGNAQFLCAGSLGYGNALWDINRADNVHPVYNGTKYTVPDGVKMIQPNKIFIMLGMNDIGLYGVDQSIENMKILTSNVEAACPSAVIYIESVTPMLVDSQLRDLNNTTIAQFDAKLKTVCAERGYHYLDIASAVEDGNGNLIYEYCSDATAMGLHFSDAGCNQWVTYLKNHVNDQ